MSTSWKWKQAGWPPGSMPHGTLFYFSPRPHNWIVHLLLASGKEWYNLIGRDKAIVFICFPRMGRVCPGLCEQDLLGRSSPRKLGSGCFWKGQLASRFCWAHLLMAPHHCPRHIPKARGEGKWGDGAALGSPRHAHPYHPLLGPPHVRIRHLIVFWLFFNVIGLSPTPPVFLSLLFYIHLKQKLTSQKKERTTNTVPLGMNSRDSCAQTLDSCAQTWKKAGNSLSFGLV